MRTIGLAALAAALVASDAAQAAVIESSPVGFQVKESVEIAAPAAKVWAALGNVGAWWDPQHTWSKDAKNLSLDLTAGGCWCEFNLPSGPGGSPNRGGAHHMTVLMVMPRQMAVMDGTLGPLMFSGATGHLVWQLAEKDGRTTLTQTYLVGGYYPGGLGALAGPVDGVLTEQLGRLKAYVETGKPG